MKTLQQLAIYLINEKINFSYEYNQITITDPAYTTFQTASYHRETKKLILMDYKFNEVNNVQF